MPRPISRRARRVRRDRSAARNAQSLRFHGQRGVTKLRRRMRGRGMRGSYRIASGNTFGWSAPRTGRADGAIRRLRHAGAIPRRHHGRAPAHPRRRQPVRRVAYGPGGAGGRGCRRRVGAPDAGRCARPEAEPSALRAAAERGRRHRRRLHGRQHGRQHGRRRGREAVPGGQCQPQAGRSAAHRISIAGRRHVARPARPRAAGAAGTRRRGGAGDPVAGGGGADLYGGLEAKGNTRG